ncbi:hypothetical protein DY245_42040 [Streptomyces inhibens]|uniref:Uncharacterized protein n=1 Tax=Streptomyces inhibens TaxID=2293571 RepID=A0A371PQ62_STRIH|nr:hypothetical protein DY245_42040 [Streptomyces inhibens]
MTPSLEWTGYLPAAVSAVHALGSLVRLCWERSPVGGKTRRSRAAEGPWDCEGRCWCVAGVPVVRVDVAAEVPVMVRIAVAVGPAGSGATAGGEPGPW